MFEQISDVFFDEVNELLDNLEGHLLSLESDPTNNEIISAVFRAMHTIKGSAGMFGFDEIANFTHKLENIFDMTRNGIIPITPELINLTLQARDHIRTLLESEITPELQNASIFILEEFDQCIEQYKTDVENFFFEDTKKDDEESSKEPEEKLNTWRISFTPTPNVLQNGTRVDLLLNELIEMGSSTIVTFCDKIPPLSQIDETLCYFYWDIFLTTSKTKNDIEDVFIFVDNSSITIEQIQEKDFNKKIGEILISRNIVSENALSQAINEQRRIGDILIQKNLASEQQIQSALAEQKHLSSLQKNEQPEPTHTVVNTSSQSIRVNSVKLDQLINLVGELVTFNARLSSISDKIHNTSLTTLSELAESLIFSLRDTSMDMRMVPIGSIFSKFKRLVHDLSNDLDKKIELITEGADTELDKNVIEKLNDPLIHLIRNSCDHGIESPQKRELSGKNLIGTVKLSATHAGSFVLITVSDDGNGLNKEAILNKALANGLINSKDDLSDQQIYELIFKPGFSTTEVVTSLSGRGVGMDVVRKDIDSLGGSISIETESGKGTSFILKIPLTLAIIDGMLVQIGENKYVIPVSNVVECIEYKATNEEDFLCSHIILRDEYFPCINMRNYFEITGNPEKEQQIVIVNDQTSKFGIIVDQIIGNHQTVIKPIGKLFKHIQGISGSTILGDGSIAIILDIFKLSDIIRKMDKNKC